MKQQKIPFYSVDIKKDDGTEVSHVVYFGDIIEWEITSFEHPFITIYTPIVIGGHKIVGITDEEDGAEFYFDWMEFKTKNNQ